MKQIILFLSSILSYGILFAQGIPGVSLTDHRTAEQMMSVLTKENVTILNPALDCDERSAATYLVDDSVLLHNGIILSNSSSKFFLTGIGPFPSESGGIWPYESLFYKRDEDLNNILRSWGTDTQINSFHSCKLMFDMIPQTDTIKLDYIFSGAGSGGSAYALASFDKDMRLGCRPPVDICAIMVSGGSEDYHKKNFAVIPGTDIAVNGYAVNPFVNPDSFKMCRDGVMAGWEGVPYGEYRLLWSELEGSALNEINTWSTTRMEAVIPVTACDTYSVKLITAKTFYFMTEADYHPSALPPDLAEHPENYYTFINGGDYLFLENLRGVGTVYECPTEDTTTSIGVQSGYTALNIYPNPASTSIQVDVSKVKYNSGRIVIYDMTGKQVYTESLQLREDKPQISVKDFPSGVYTLLFHTDRGNYKGKFTIER